MTLEIFKAKEELRNLIDSYASLGDEKKIAAVMDLFTADINYKVYMNNFLVSDVSGRENMEKDFNKHASEVKTYFTLNGQHQVEINGNNANGVSFSQLKMVRENDGKDILTDYSVKYEDTYVLQDGKWLIKNRIGYFFIIESRVLNN
ncbi:nuclear transport factor 2 family protein [Flavobacterium quisquiliarum]|uniref:Nuclear transport factor 2 family protein n=1 Tax=Flavobacterium quisquiliarum TaxID=1834436 RepID=A0ABV8W3J9_9FLAO|nr:nuclear transport factor 2 family protein [Flavobacterium quisquiliarum]MBW1656969.1 nuclear transport factor 2 family protein [Flavobacterium quisquiliarum]NWK99634.1 nuclear transport factor 2 family protein [Flavobacterium collinsii]